MVSLSLHSKDPSSVSIYVIISQDDMGGARRLLDCFQMETAALAAAPTVTLLDMQPIGVNVSRLRNIPRNDLLRSQNFVRFYVHRYLPFVERAIWLDHDTIIQHDVAELFGIRMRHPLAAVPDQKALQWPYYFANTEPHLHHFFKNISLPNFNAGVLVLELSFWRSGVVTRQLEKLMETFSGFLGDQLALNVYFQSQYDVIDWRWNVGSLGGLPFRLPLRCISEARILHWSGPLKPWQREGVSMPNTVLYWNRAPHFACLLRQPMIGLRS
eukprot:TRINITY_DN39408_c0_g2_i1.p1 TRINITY_DN39408_c0_g2~~TRINITY_DN39408_c0_g2_i1.p1  ORF type:complete len:304 (-),score=18.62 TRINITY_DN39408_c0_g2_i1:495-1304(-)